MRPSASVNGLAFRHSHINLFAMNIGYNIAPDAEFPDGIASE
jgi:hypothetical protein